MEREWSQKCATAVVIGGVSVTRGEFFWPPIACLGFLEYYVSSNEKH
jgi:hypothetical protein